MLPIAFLLLAAAILGTRSAQPGAAEADRAGRRVAGAPRSRVGAGAGCGRRRRAGRDRDPARRAPYSSARARPRPARPTLAGGARGRPRTPTTCSRSPPRPLLQQALVLELAGDLDGAVDAAARGHRRGADQLAHLAGALAPRGEGRRRAGLGRRLPARRARSTRALRCFDDPTRGPTDDRRTRPRAR